MLHHQIIGDGRPILIIHGVTQDHRYMMDALEPVFEVTPGWQRIYIDLPGHGRSPAQDDIRSQDDLLNTVIDFLDAQMPVGQFSVIGLSRGSYIARGIAHERLDRIAGLALIVPGGNPSSDPTRLPEHRVLRPNPALRRELADNEVWGFDNVSVIQSKDSVERRRRTVLPARALFDAEQEARVFEAFDFSFHESEMQQIIEAPSLIVAGRQDAISGYLDGIDIAARYPRATLAVLDSAGHAVVWERPALFEALVKDWLERVAHDLERKDDLS